MIDPGLDNVENVICHLVGGARFAFYANLDTLDTSVTFDSWDLHLVYTDTFIIAYPNIGVLEQDLITATGFRFYSEFSVPEGLEGNCYYLMVVDNSNYDEVKYVSNKLKYTDSTNAAAIRKLQLLRYRNDKNRNNYNYEVLQGFYNTYYVEMQRRQGLNRSSRQGYELVDGSFNQIRDATGKTYEFTTDFYSDEDHFAWDVTTLHNNLFIAFDGFYNLMARADDSDLNIEWTENFPLANGSIRLEKKRSFSSSKLI